MTTHYRGIGSYGRPRPDRSAKVARRTLWILRARRQVIRKNTGRSTEYPVPKLNALIDGDVVLYFHTIANNDVVCNVYVLPEAATCANPSSRLDVTKVPHLGSVSDRCALIDNGRRVHERRHENSPVMSSVEQFVRGSLTGAPVLWL